MKLRTTASGVLLLAALGAVSCDKKPSDAHAAAATSAAPIGIAECAACGMVVREQPAPRGQVVHRDGTRVHLCSIGDMVHYLQTPSPHGKPAKIHVEALPVDFDPTGTDTNERPWVDAEKASYVVGVERKRVMGRAVLAYAERAQAEAAAKRLSGQLKTWEELPKFVLQH